jgi:hypothetical protein
MRLRFIAVVFLTVIAIVSESSAQPGSQADPTGSWLFIWQNNSANTNSVNLKYEDGTITGAYINDSKEKCPVAGRWNSTEAKVTLTIACPRWEIKCEGSIKDSNLVTGRYVAYGNATGDFRLLRP